ncbi:MAG: GntR family transcriptional regulator [Planctomycetes bacterium]|nr:GntR family transcriptional regulator [Planctomycetota bacterium]
MIMRDTVNSEPVYQQLHHELQALIDGGEFAVGDKFLSERQIADRFSVSRPTANKVLASFMHEGILLYQKGVGTFVQEPVLSYDLRNLVSFTDKAKAIGKTPQTQVLLFERKSAADIDAVIQKELAVDGTDEVFYMERLRLADDEPVIFEQRYVPVARCPDLDAEQVQDSLYTIWTEHYALQIAGADQRIRAISADVNLAGHLAIDAGAACFEVQCTGYTADNTALWWERTSYNGNNYELISRLGNQDDGQPVRGALY